MTEQLFARASAACELLDCQLARFGPHANEVDQQMYWAERRPTGENIVRLLLPTVWPSLGYGSAKGVYPRLASPLRFTKGELVRAGYFTMRVMFYDEYINAIVDANTTKINYTWR